MARAEHRASDRWRAALPAAVAAVLCLGACGHDWTTAGPQDDAGGPDPADVDGVVAPDAPGDDTGAEDASPDETGAGDADAEPGADGDGGPEDDDSAAPDDGETLDEAPVDEVAAEDASGICGNGTVERGEECDGDPSRPCAVPGCTGEQVCASDCTWAPCDLGEAPENDSCDGVGGDAYRIEDRFGVTMRRGTTCVARDDVAPSCAGGGGPDVIFVLGLRGRRQVEIDTAGSAFDTVLQVGSGACPGLPVACDDHGAGGTGDAARLSLTLEAGDWWIVLDGARSDQQGSYALQVSIADAPIGPANDECAAARRLDLDRAYRLESGTTRGARDDAAGCGGSRGVDVWYRFDVGSRKPVYFDLIDGQPWDSVLDLRQGACGSTTWTTVACGDDACGGTRSQIAALLEPGEYYLVVDGKTTEDQGEFVLRTLGADASCATALPIIADDVYTGTTVGGPTNSRPMCGLSLGSTPEAYYFLALCPGRTLLASTCNDATEFDTILSLGAGSCRDVWLAYNDDSDSVCLVEGAEHASTLTVPITDAGLYFLVVDGATSGPGIPAAGPYGLAASGL